MSKTLEHIADIRIASRPLVFTEIEVPEVLKAAIPEDQGMKLVYCRAFINSVSKIRIIFSIEHHANGLNWVHVTTSHRNRLPSWEELVYTKEIFIGNVWVYQVLPPKEHYMNISENCLHLWHCPDKDLMKELSGKDWPRFGTE